MKICSKVYIKKRIKMANVVEGTNRKYIQNMTEKKANIAKKNVQDMPENMSKRTYTITKKVL